MAKLLKWTGSIVQNIAVVLLVHFTMSALPNTTTNIKTKTFHLQLELYCFISTNMMLHMSRELLLFVVVVAFPTYFFCLSQKTCSCCCYFLFFFHIGIYDLCSKYVCVFYVVVCWLVFVCIFFSFFKAIFAWSKLETLCCIPLQPCGELKKHI